MKKPYVLMVDYGCYEGRKIWGEYETIEELLLVFKEELKNTIGSLEMYKRLEILVEE